MEEKHGLHHTLQDKLEFYWKEFSNALKMYQENNQDRKLAFEELKEKDDISAQEIDQQMRKLTRISVCWLSDYLYLSPDGSFALKWIKIICVWYFFVLGTNCSTEIKNGLKC